MILKKHNKEIIELSELEIVNRFLESDHFKDRCRELPVRLALFISDKESKGLSSTFTAEEFYKIYDVLELQLLFKKISVPEYRDNVKVYKKRKLNSKIESLLEKP